MHGNQPISIEVMLASLPLFSGLGKEELARIARGTRQIHAAKDEVLFCKGDRCEGFHLVLIGRVKLVFTTAEGNERVVEILGQGQTFGEAMMLEDQAYAVSALALTDSLLLHVSRTVLFDEFDRDPGLRLKMLAGLSRRLQELMDDVESFSLRSGKQRVANYFLYLLPGNSPAKDATLTLPTSKANIASRLNLTQEHFSRILRELSSQGLIVVQGSQILIPDVRALRAESG